MNAHRRDSGGQQPGVDRVQDADDATLGIPLREVDPDLGVTVDRHRVDVERLELPAQVLGKRRVRELDPQRRMQDGPLMPSA